MKELTKEQKDKFGWLCNRLSPENLHCDGEISHSQAMQRKKKIMAEWSDLEREVGRDVSEEEIYRS